MELAKIQVNGVRACVKQIGPIPAGTVGATICIEYADQIWANLSKTVVFRGCVTKDVVDTGEIVTIPAEVIAKPGGTLFVGVYGVNTEETLVVPTLWADLGRIRAAAAPSEDTSTDPSLPVWAQLQAEVDDLRENGVNKEEINEIVDSLPIVKTQAEYDAMVAAGTVNENALYFIKEEPL